MTPEEQARENEWRETLCIAYRWRNRENGRLDKEQPCGYCGGCKAAPIVAIALAERDREIERLRFDRDNIWKNKEEIARGHMSAIHERDAFRAQRDALAEAAKSAEQALLRRGEREAASWLNHARALAAGKERHP